MGFIKDNYLRDRRRRRKKGNVDERKNMRLRYCYPLIFTERKDWKKKKTTNVMTGNTNGDVFERDRILKERERR